MPELAVDHRFSLTHGGPFFRLLRRVRLVAPKGNVRWFWLVPITWLPIGISAASRFVAGERLAPVMRDASVHARLLVALPLILIAEKLLEERVERSMYVMRQERLTDEAHLDSILHGVERLRDSRVVEAIFAILCVIRSQTLLWGGNGPLGFVQGLEQVRGISFAGLWYVGFCLPLLNFLMLRWLWQWLMWIVVLVRFARLPLEMNGMHPDGAAGLKFLSMPTSALATFLAGMTSIASATWSMKILHGQATLQSFIPMFVVLIVAAALLAFGPLMLFSAHVCRARHRDLTLFHAFSHEYVQQFKRSWLSGKPRQEDVLGLSDIQSLNDLGGSYDRTEKTSMFPFGVRTLATLWLGALIPVLPVVLSAMPLSEVIEHLGKILLGGLPT
ncbi:MAG: hypothetical protein HOV81_43815 [Kofleriaceae bacterium]|nr:hypothetical protein [Kofleriaceae bacterium]